MFRIKGPLALDDNDVFFADRQRSCSKVMFSQVPVIVSIGRGRVSLVPGSFLVIGPMSF